MLFRNMQKNKLHTAINMVGMTVASTCSILLFLMAYFMFSFDQFHKNKSTVFKVYNHLNGPNGKEVGSSVSYPLRNAVLMENMGIQKATLIRNAGSGVKYKDKELGLSVKLVDNDFFSIFSFPVVKGNSVAPLANLGDAAISEYAAKKIFNIEDPIGKAIKVSVAGVWQDLTISSIIKDFPQNSSLNFDILARTELHPSYAQQKNSWNFEHSALFVMLDPQVSTAVAAKNLSKLLGKYNAIDTSYMKGKGYHRDANGYYASIDLLPLTELHFSKDLGEGNSVSKSSLYIVLLIGIVILLIACFNFVNLNIGMSFTRTKEMGIRKCLGAGKRQVWLQIWGESFFICLLSFLLGLMAAGLLINAFNNMYVTKLDIKMLYDPILILIFLGILLLVSFIAGAYPSSIVAAQRAVDVLKGKISLKTKGGLRNGLIVVQFVIACVLICTTIIIYQQFQYLRTAPLGYTTSSLISVPIHDDSKGHELIEKLRNRLSSQTSVEAISGTSVNLGMGKDGSSSKWSMGFDYNGHSINTNLLFADHNILQTLGMKPVEGRDFSAAYVSDTANAVILTESMAKQFPEKNMLGLSFRMDEGGPLVHVIGVIPDFHLYSMYEKQEPLTIKMGNADPLSYALIRVRTNNPYATLEMVKNAFAQLEPGVLFTGSYVDENIDRWYSNEKRLSQMFSVSALIAIILSCMGLFGITLITIRQRVKEIGVRKVLGASVSNVAMLVTKDFIKPVLLSILIATPIAWWAMHKWLQDFTYRITISWWVFVIAGLFAIVIALLTISFQAIKAALANPVKSLRTE